MFSWLKKKKMRNFAHAHDLRAPPSGQHGPKSHDDRVEILKQRRAAWQRARDPPLRATSSTPQPIHRQESGLLRVHSLDIDGQPSDQHEAQLLRQREAAVKEAAKKHPLWKKIHQHRRRFRGYGKGDAYYGTRRRRPPSEKTDNGTRRRRSPSEKTDSWSTIDLGDSKRGGRRGRRSRRRKRYRHRRKWTARKKRSRHRKWSTRRKRVRRKKLSRRPRRR